MQATAYIFPWIISITLTFTMGIYALRRRRNLAAIPFAAMCLLATWWSIFYIGGVLSYDLHFKILMAKIMYLGVLGVPLSWTAFALAFSGRGDWINKRSSAIVLVVPLITYAMVWTTDIHHLHWSSLSLVTDEVTGLVLLDAPAGMWFWIHAVYTYSILLFGTVFLVRQFFESQAIYRWQIFINLIAIVAPWIVNALVVFSLIKTRLDITSLTFSFSILLLGWGYFRFGFLDLVPVAQREVFNNIPDVVIVLDPNLRVAELNPASLRTFGLGAAFVIGQPFGSVFGQWLPFSELELRTDGFHQELALSINQKPETWFDLSINTLYDNPTHLTGYLVIMRDITSFKIARDEAMRANNFKTQLLANVSHELRTPLGVISGYVDLISRGSYGDVTDKQVKILGRVKESTQYLDGLVSELIDQAQLDSGKLHLAVNQFEPREVFGQIFSQLSILADAKNIGFTGVVSEDMPVEIVGDSQRLKQILVNLISNAIKFTESGSVNASIVRLSDEQWVMQVSDSGPGIPPEAMQTIFEPFRQLEHAIKHIRKGYGLGLSISKQLVEMMNGRIEVQSQVGEGSKFTITLPLVTSLPEDFQQ